MELNEMEFLAKNLIAKEGFRAFSLLNSCIFPVRSASDRLEFDRKGTMPTVESYYIYLVERNYKNRKENPTKFGVQIPYNITKEQLEDKIKTSAQKYREYLSSTKRKGV